MTPLPKATRRKPMRGYFLLNILCIEYYLRRQKIILNLSNQLHTWIILYYSPSIDVPKVDDASPAVNGSKVDDTSPVVNEDDPNSAKGPEGDDAANSKDDAKEKEKKTYSRYPKFKVTWDPKIPSLMSNKNPKKKARNSVITERFGLPM